MIEWLGAILVQDIFWEEIVWLSKHLLPLNQGMQDLSLTVSIGLCALEKFPKRQPKCFLWRNITKCLAGKTDRQLLCGHFKNLDLPWFSFLFSFLLSLFLFFIFMATLVAYGSSQAGGWIGASAGIYTTALATWDPSWIFHLCDSLWYRQILNPLSEARDQTFSQRLHQVLNSLSYNENSYLDFQLSFIQLIICIN